MSDDPTATVKLHAWFGRVIFQEGARVVVHRACSSFDCGENPDEHIPIVAVCEVVAHTDYAEDPRARVPCEHGGTRMDVLGPFSGRSTTETWTVCTCECVLYDVTATDGGEP